MALEIKYDGEVIATLEKGQTATIQCTGKKMATDLVVAILESSQTLATPTVSLDGNILSISTTDPNIDSFAILVDGVQKTTVSVNTSRVISFTVDGTTYQADAGMTWGQWVESEYNTAGFYASQYDNDVMSIYTSTGSSITSVYSTQLIIENGEYNLPSHGGGSND